MPTTRSRPPGSRQPSRAATPRTGTCRTPVPPHRRTRSDEEAMLIRLRLGDERGVALVVALLVSFVVLLLGTAVVSLSLHNLDASGYDRRRLLSVGAAEAGLDTYYETIERTPPSSLPCTLSGSVSSGPSTATYEASIEVFNAAGAEIACPPSGTSAVAAMITSTGRSGSTLARTMQSYVRMSPIYGGWSAAIFADTPTTIGQRMTINSASGSEGSPDDVEPGHRPVERVGQRQRHDEQRDRSRGRHVVHGKHLGQQPGHDPGGCNGGRDGRQRVADLGAHHARLYAGAAPRPGVASDRL